MNPFENESCKELLKKNSKNLYNIYLGNFEIVEPLLNSCTPPGYTNHGKNHIEMVEQYVGRLLGPNRINKLTNEELFILLMGVLCHDLGMMDYYSFGKNYIPDRENHNINSYLKVFNRSKNARGQLDINVPRNNSKYYQSIALLCLGHRDHKERGRKICTLNEFCTIEGEKVEIPDTVSLPDNTDVHVKYLAAILRLADEIDVTNQRAPKDVEMLLKNFITEETKEHWLTHQLIEKVEITHKKAQTTIHLYPNKEEIRAIIDDREHPISKKQLLRLVFSRRKKIEEEISIINKITWNPLLPDSDLGVSYNIEIVRDNEIVTEEDYIEYQKDVDKQLKEEHDLYPKQASDYEESERLTQKKEKEPLALFYEELQKLKKDRNLLETGSFKFSFETGKNEYTQFFINTQLLLTNRNMLDNITDIFLNHFSDNNIDCVIGIGKAGIILAPNLSLKLNCNSSYLISKWEDTSSVDWEKRVSVIDTAKNVLVLLDVISTGIVTIENLERIKNKNKNHLQNIYIGTIFCTNKTIKEKIEKEDKVKELFSINNDFQFKTYSQEEYEYNEEFRKEFELLPLRKNRL